MVFIPFVCIVNEFSNVANYIANGIADVAAMVRNTIRERNGDGDGNFFDGVDDDLYSGDGR